MVYIYALIEMVQAHPNWKELFGGAEAETGQIQPRGYSAQGFHFAGGNFLGQNLVMMKDGFVKGLES